MFLFFAICKKKKKNRCLIIVRQLVACYSISLNVNCRRSSRSNCRRPSSCSATRLIAWVTRKLIFIVFLFSLFFSRFHCVKFIKFSLSLCLSTLFFSFLSGVAIRLGTTLAAAGESIHETLSPIVGHKLKKKNIILFYLPLFFSVSALTDASLIFFNGVSSILMFPISFIF